MNRDALYRRYLLGVLLVILACTNMDSLTLGLLTQDIKRAMHLTDTQIGFLSGLAFAVFYSMMGIPLARWADRGNRITLIGLTTAAWALMFASCGLSKTFGQLLLARVGVAVGEAGCIPAAQSLIADYFTRAERPRAVGIYMLGGSASIVVGYFLAGRWNELYGWRLTFLLIGLPALIPAALAWSTLKEPRLSPVQGPAVTGTPAGEKEPTLRDTCAALWRNLTFRRVLYCYSVVYFFGWGLAQWQPAFFIRSYGLSTGELGTWLALIGGCGSLLGTYLGGALASRYARNNEALQLKAMAVAYCAFALITSFVYLSSRLYLSLLSMGVAGIGAAMTTGPLFAIIQTLVPARMRAMAIAVVYFVANLIGMGLGPLVAGSLSDALRPIVGSESLRYALLILCPGYLWGGWHLWRASRTVTHDLRLAQSEPCGSVREVAAV